MGIQWPSLRLVSGSEEYRDAPGMEENVVRSELSL